MASRRNIVAATTTDALALENIRRVEGPSVVNLWASCVTVTDTIGLLLDNFEIMAPGLLNIHAAALGLVNSNSDQLVFATVVGRGDLRMPCVVTTSLIFLLSVEPII